MAGQRSAQSLFNQHLDLRLGGAIEWHADLVVFVYRDEVYDEGTKDKDITELIVGKQRNGLDGTIKVRFVDTLTRFEDLAPGRYDAAAHDGGRRE